MRPMTRLLALFAAMLTVALIGAGSAYACHGPPSAKAELASFTSMHNHGAHGLLAVTAAYLDIDRAALKSQLAAGKSISEIAPEGKTAAGLADAYMTAIKARLDAKVAAQKITQATEDAWLAKLDPRVTAFAAWLWTKHFTGAEHGRHRFAHHHHHG
jgi:hypothetical protein